MMQRVTWVRVASDETYDTVIGAPKKSAGIELVESAGVKQVRCSPGGMQNMRKRTSCLERLLVSVVVVLLLVVSILAVLLGINFTAKVTQNEYCVTPECVTLSSTILSAMDSGKAPCVDFYQYACGGWIRSSQRPDEELEWGISKKLERENEVTMKNILEDKSIELTGAAEKKVRIYYFSCLFNKNFTIDQLEPSGLLKIIDKDGGSNISGHFRIDEWNLQNTVHSMGSRLFPWHFDVDDKNPSKRILHLGEGGLGLPSRDYYLNKHNSEVLEAYLQNMTKVGVLLGGEEDDVISQMTDVIAFETKLADILKPPGAFREYERMTVSHLQHLAPVVNWTQFLNHNFKDVHRLITADEEIIVHDPEFMTKVKQMISEIRDAFKHEFLSSKWMDPDTVKLVNEKVDAITEMIGFPELILDPKKLDKMYEGLEFIPEDYLENRQRVRHFLNLKRMKLLNKPVDRTEWHMTPIEINAYYSRQWNQIVLPAGILQPPYFHPKYPKSINFASIGTAIGHELAHAFDQEGLKYDKEGNLGSWWKVFTVRKFHQKAQCLVDQYSSYEFNGVHLDGQNKLADNIADNAGLKVAFHAYNDWVRRHEPELPLPAIQLSHRQLFFVRFAQMWCSANTPLATLIKILFALHAIPKYRIIGTLSNSEDFAREFKCPVNSPMNPVKKCVVY